MNAVTKLRVHNLVGVFAGDQNGFLAKMNIPETVVVQYY